MLKNDYSVQSKMITGRLQYSSILAEATSTCFTFNVARRYVLSHDTPSIARASSPSQVYQDGDGSTYRSILGDGLHVNTYQGLFQRSLLQPLPRLTDSSTAAAAADDDATSDKILPTDVGSRIGIVYVVRDRMAEMHFVINGEDQGACAHDIPYRDASVYAVVDVYGATKQVRIVQLYGGEAMPVFVIIIISLFYFLFFYFIYLYLIFFSFSSYFA